MGALLRRPLRIVRDAALEPLTPMIVSGLSAAVVWHTGAGVAGWFVAAMIAGYSLSGST